MEILIQNFANIKKLNFEIENSKLNFIYGISGSGKSSISKALTIETDKINEYKTFGIEEDTTVCTTNKFNFMIFDDEAIKEYVFIKSGKGVYDVLFGENEDLLRLKDRLSKFLSSEEVLDIRNVINKHKELINKIEIELGLSTTKTGAISRKGLYSTLSKPKTYQKVQTEIDVKQKSWIKQGHDFIVNDECPFCFQIMSENILSRIKEIVNELPNDYQTLIKASENLEKLGIKIDIEKINEEETQVDFKKKIDIEYKILKDMKKIEDILNISIHNDESLSKNIKISLEKETINLFLEYDIDIISFLKDLEKGSACYLMQKKKYNGVLKTQIKKNIEKINQYIDMFGIKYRFVKTDYLSKDISYNLIHVNAETDSTEFLSTGEKNIIALILFLISNKNNNLIIDDPVSSYDEYRREQILKFIIRYRYLDNSRMLTTLILSHDQIFLKFLVRFIKNTSYQEIIGKVYHLENIDGECKTQIVAQDDVDTLFSHIKKRCQEVENYGQKIINLRLLYEFLDKDSIEYKYLSAILHSGKENLTSEKLNKLLKDKGSSEGIVLKKISDQTGIVLPRFKQNSFNIDVKKISKFELLCYVREEIQSPLEKKELNSIVHFNYSLFHVLNPYKFNFQSEMSYSILNMWLKNNNNEV